MEDEVVWVGPYPAHYTRVFHEEIQERWSGLFRFIYVVRRGRAGGRSYERGNLPNQATVVQGKAIASRVGQVTRHLKRIDPRMLVVSGHSPPAVAWAGAWGLARSRKVAYRSDTNLVDVLRSRSLPRRIFHLLFLGRMMFRFIDVLLYAGTLNRLYYRWAMGKQTEVTREVRLPLPHSMPSVVAGSQEANPGATGNEPVTFLFMGRLAAEKSVHSLVEAARCLPAPTPQWRILIAGDGEERAILEERAAKYDLVNRLEFLGEIESTDRWNVYRRADVFVLPSSSEPWGIVVNEALSSGLTVLAPYWVGAVSDLVVDGYNGLVLDSNSPEALAEGMQQLVDNPELVRKMGQRGPDIVSSGRWNVEGSIEGMEKVLHELL